MEENKKNKEFNRMRFLQELIRDFIIRKGRSDVDRTYNGYMRFLEELKQRKPEEAEERKAILDKVYKMFSDSEIRQIVSKKGITVQRFMKEFVPKYGEYILGDNKRKYDMSEMYDRTIIASKKDNKSERDITYRGYDRKQGIVDHVYSDTEGNSITIQRIGNLDFTTFNGVKDYISKYRVTRGDGSIVEVYSNIVFPQMDDPMYRQAVLYELLSRNNIELSKAGGYVGEIVKLTEGDKSLQIGNTRETTLNYLYRINSEYAIEYRASDLSAVMMQSMKEESNKIQESSTKRKTVDPGEER